MSLVGLVVVSHSRKLAEAAVELAEEMVPEQQPSVRIAAGMPDGEFGTNATEVMAAIQEASTGSGVVVLVDLGSAIMSAEMALEFLEGEITDVRVVAAPFVEGLLAAMVVAASGGDLDAVADEAASALHPKLEALGGQAAASPAGHGNDPWAPEQSSSHVVINTAGLHARPAALIAAEAARFDAEVRLIHARGAAAAMSPIALATMAASPGETLTVEARGPQAKAVVAAIGKLIDSGFGEETAARQQPAEIPAGRLKPIGVSGGRVVGLSKRMSGPLSSAPPARFLDASGIEKESHRLEQAISAIVAEYTTRAQAADGEVSTILNATAMLAADPSLRQAANDLIINHEVPAANAFWQATNHVIEALFNAGDLMAERVVDIVDIRDRVVRNLLGIPKPGVPQSDEPFILIAEDLAPSDTATLSPETCLGILTAGGGPTSHTAILARSIGIPAVVGARSVLEIKDGSTVLVDGTTGEVIVDPSPEQLRGASNHIGVIEPLRGPGATADGKHVALLANIGSEHDTQLATRAGAEGIGLFRTEFCFLNRQEEPAFDEQVRRYRTAIEAFAHRRVIVRTLDAGSDKPMPFLGVPNEPNPALGIRGYRTAIKHPDVLDRQLRAIAHAAAEADVELWVMAPMISTAAEASEFVGLAKDAGIDTAGIMIETPSAAMVAPELFRHVDFVSVGTNDLTQYAMAADREGAELGSFQDPWQPGVLRLLQVIGNAAREAGKPAGICGEAASDPRLAPVLAGLGFSSLSMGPRQLRSVATALSRVTMRQCRSIADAALTAETPSQARQAAAEVS